MVSCSAACVPFTACHCGVSCECVMCWILGDSCEVVCLCDYVST